MAVQAVERLFPRESVQEMPLALALAWGDPQAVRAPVPERSRSPKETEPRAPVFRQIWLTPKTLLAASPVTPAPERPWLPLAERVLVAVPKGPVARL